jgi:hypothetical protein
MVSIPYKASRKSVYKPGKADDFFQFGPIKNDAALCAEMARLAYVKEESRLTKYLDRVGFQISLTLGYNADGTQVFIASKPGDNLLVMSFRGTEISDPADLFTDANFVMESWADASGKVLGRVHTGFAEALLKNDVLQKITAHLDLVSPSTRILLTGHSLGSALATLMASCVRSAHLYTFGSPRVGDPSFAEAMQAVNHSRFVNCCDAITQVPAKQVFGYKHTGTLWYIDRDGKLHESPSDESISADRRKAEIAYLIKKALLPGTVFSRTMADHAPINYLSGVMGCRE